CECNQLERSDPNTPSESHGMAFWALPRGSLLQTRFLGSEFFLGFCELVVYL
ncbi:hypothetical protein M2098_001071, partial [Breznakia sp. PFB1-19]|nr:hypothetical protein [Breznakia sp. PFB1-4]MDH6476194.1 hypothetical protein [Breznakia sp. PFB1-19]